MSDETITKAMQLQEFNREIQKLANELNRQMYMAVTRHGLLINVDTIEFNEVQYKNPICKININVYREITDAN